MDFIKEKLRDFDGYVPKQAPIEIKLDSNEGKNILLDEIFQMELQLIKILC